MNIIQSGAVIGIGIYKKSHNEIDIMEFFYQKNHIENTNMLLVKGVNHIIKKLNSKVNLWLNLFSDEHLILEKYGFNETNFVSYFGVIPFRDNVEMMPIKNWHFRFCDSDNF